MDFFFLTINLLILLCSTVNALVFSYPNQLAKLFKMEEDIISILRMETWLYKDKAIDLYLENCEPRIKEMPLEFSDLHHLNESEYLVKILEDLVGNPIHVHSLIYRLVVQMPELRKDLIDQNKTNTLEMKISKILEDIELPTKEDLVEASQAVARIQFVYRLDPVEMAEGIIKGVQTEGKLSGTQMMMIALNCINEDEFALAIEWAEAASEVTKNRGDDKLTENQIIKFLEFARTEHNKYWESPLEERGNYPNEEFFVRKIVNVTGKELRMEEQTFLAKEDDSISYIDTYNIHDFHALCRGEDIRFTYKPKNPICKLTTNNEPYFFLAPLKEEVMSKDPLVYIYHDVVTDGEMRFKKNHILSRLKPAMVGIGVLNDRRTQSNGFAFDDEHEMLNKLSKKTEKLTQLVTTRSSKESVTPEVWQVGVYGAGGHFLPHTDGPNTDAWTTDKLWVGNRIANILFYLSDAVGGSTVFLNLGLTVTPTKGSALFWNNLDKFGNSDDRSLHGGCPVALGLKWTSSKWIGEGAQIWKRPCKK